jgi:hypothetical protein
MCRSPTVRSTIGDVVHLFPSTLDPRRVKPIPPYQLCSFRRDVLCELGEETDNRWMVS